MRMDKNVSLGERKDEIYKYIPVSRMNMVEFYPNRNVRTGAYGLYVCSDNIRVYLSFSMLWGFTGYLEVGD